MAPQMMGRVASFYYLKHQTMGHLTRALRPAMPAQEVGRACGQSLLVSHTCHVSSGPEGTCVTLCGACFRQAGHICPQFQECMLE